MELSCLEMALSAGLMMSTSFHEPDRAAGGFMCVMMDNCGPTADRFLQRREIEPNRLLRRWVLLRGVGSIDLGRL